MSVRRWGAAVASCGSEPALPRLTDGGGRAARGLLPAHRGAGGPGARQRAPRCGAGPARPRVHVRHPAGARHRVRVPPWRSPRPGRCVPVCAGRASRGCGVCQALQASHPLPFLQAAALPAAAPHAATMCAFPAHSAWCGLKGCCAGARAGASRVVQPAGLVAGGRGGAARRAGAARVCGPLGAAPAGHRAPAALLPGPPPAAVRLRQAAGARAARGARRRRAAARALRAAAADVPASGAAWRGMCHRMCHQAPRG